MAPRALLWLDGTAYSEMRVRSAALRLAALVALGVAPSVARAQGPPAAPAMAPEDAEAQEMSMQLAFACSPRRHNGATGSESTIERPAGQLSGTAVFFRSIEGTFLVLEEYDEQLTGHCLVLGWFGGDLQPGRFAINQLAYSTMEAEVDTGNHSFYGVSLVRQGDENSLLIARSGSLELATVEPGRITGTFDLTGFTIGGSTRTDGVTWRGSFTAVAGEG